MYVDATYCAITLTAERMRQTQTENYVSLVMTPHCQLRKFQSRRIDDDRSLFAVLVVYAPAPGHPAPDDRHEKGMDERTDHVQTSTVAVS
jgi:hypothetical protein